MTCDEALEDAHKSVQTDKPSQAAGKLKRRLAIHLCWFVAEIWMVGMN